MTDGAHANPDSESALDAKANALRLAFAPFLFHAVCALLDFGIVRLAWAKREHGVSRAEVAEQASISPYAATVLLEAGLAARVFSLEGDRFFVTRSGYFLLDDEMTQVNIAFARDVCYGPLRRLGESLKDGRPRGLPELAAGLGDADSLYAAFDRLPAGVRQSWLAFDHFYSGLTRRPVLDLVFGTRIERLLDVGANDGRFAEACLRHDPLVEVTLVDHPVQIEVARARLAAAGLLGRASFVATDLALGPELSAEFDVVWLSQVLDCLPEADVVRLLVRLRGSLAPGGRVFILEPCWDLQPQRAGQDALVLLSLYFACAANGNSRIYDSGTLLRMLNEAGLSVVMRRDGLGVGHSLFECVAG